MNAFIVELEDKPGEVARVAEAIAQRGINIEGFAGATAGGSGSMILITNDEAGTRSALASIGCQAREAELTVASLAHQPGTLAELTRRLADAGVNIQAAIPTGMDAGNVSVAFATDNPTKAREIIGERAAAPAM